MSDPTEWPTGSDHFHVRITETFLTQQPPSTGLNTKLKCYLSCYKGKSIQITHAKIGGGQGMNLRKVQGKQAVEELFNGYSSLLNFGQNKKKIFFPVKVIQWSRQSKIVGEPCWQNPPFPMSMEAQQIHYCASWKPTDFEAYTVMQSLPSGCLSFSV